MILAVVAAECSRRIDRQAGGARGTADDLATTETPIKVVTGPVERRRGWCGLRGITTSSSRIVHPDGAFVNT
jgi:hypothetical protein